MTPRGKLSFFLAFVGRLLAELHTVFGHGAALDLNIASVFEKVRNFLIGKFLFIMQYFAQDTLDLHWAIAFEIARAQISERI